MAAGVQSEISVIKWDRLNGPPIVWWCPPRTRRSYLSTTCARSGVELATTQKLMHHCTPELTANTYVQLGSADLAAAVAKLPKAPRVTIPWNSG